MGEVYKAEDSRLHRFVAIKVLPEAASDRVEVGERFRNEARTLASLNHPHICSVFDVGRHEGRDYLVMELLEGQTLSQRLEKGPLSLDEALQIAIDVTDALDKAHRQLLAEVLRQDRWTHAQFELAARRAGLLPLGARETLNDYTIDVCDDVLLETEDDAFVLNLFAVEALQI